MDDMTHDEMLAKAKEVFGEEVSVRYEDYQWVVYTGLGEKFDIEKYKDTPAYVAYHEKEGTYGSTLDRWAVKNSYGSSSMDAVCEAYNAMIEAHWKDAAVQVRRWVAEGREFAWTGGPEYRDQVLKMAEENGW